jgi:hypothetical protein
VLQCESDPGAQQVREKRERERGEEEEREREERGERMMPAQRLFFSRFGRTKPARAFLPQTAKYDETAPVSLSPPHAQVLSEHFPGVELAHDIRSLQSLPEVEKKERKRERRREEKGPAAAGCGGGGGKTHSLREKKIATKFLHPRESTSSSPASPAWTSPGQGSGPGSTAGRRGWCALFSRLPFLLAFFSRFSSLDERKGKTFPSLVSLTPPCPK